MTRGHVKGMSHDYQRTMEDIDKVDIFQSNNAFTLQTHGKVKKCWMTIRNLGGP